VRVQAASLAPVLNSFWHSQSCDCQVKLTATKLLANTALLDWLNPILRCDGRWPILLNSVDSRSHLPDLYLGRVPPQRHNSVPGLPASLLPADDLLGWAPLQRGRPEGTEARPMSDGAGRGDPLNGMASASGASRIALLVPPRTHDDWQNRCERMLQAEPPLRPPEQAVITARFKMSSPRTATCSSSVATQRSPPGLACNSALHPGPRCARRPATRPIDQTIVCA